MRFAWLGAGAALALIVVAGCSSRGSAPAEKASSSAQAIQNGVTDTSHTFVMGLCGGDKGYCEAICTGTLILPNLVATARHCVDHVPDPENVECLTAPSFGPRRFGPGAQTLWVTSNTEMLADNGAPLGAGWHSVKSILTPSDSHICGNDIALLILSDIVAGNEARPIVPGVQYPMNDPRYSTRFAAIGYGNTSTLHVGAGTRRIRQGIRVACVPGDEYMDCADPTASPPVTIADLNMSPNEFRGGSGTCSGDSGSGAFEDSTFGAAGAVSFGVLSRGGKDEDAGLCVGSIYTRFDKWRELVVQAAADASGNWTRYPRPSPDWTVYVPPPVADAGKDAKPIPAPSGFGLGEACAGDAECTSKKCIDPGDGSLICSQACAEGAACPDGYDCSADKVCAPSKAAAAPTTTTTTTSGCSLAVSPRPTPWRWLGLVLSAILLARRHRKV